MLFFSSEGAHRHFPSFPTRRSSDLRIALLPVPCADHPRAARTHILRKRGFRARHIAMAVDEHGNFHQNALQPRLRKIDRKSTRLNSSHTVISYAVFCLKKKTAETTK